MPKAAKRSTTTRRPALRAPTIARDAPLVPLPSVADLARRYNTLMDAKHFFDGASLQAPENSKVKHDADAAFAQCEAECEALIQIILSRPITTLADATALAVHGFMEAESSNQPDLQRAFARIALVCADAASVSPELFGSGHTLTLLQRHAGAGRAL